MVGISEIKKQILEKKNSHNFTYVVRLPTTINKKYYPVVPFGA
jgi:hypothetical protein